MVLKSIGKKVKSAGRKIREAQAKVQGYTSPEEMMEHKKKLREIERQERKRFKEWQVREKFRQKCQQIEQGKPGGGGVIGFFKTMAENAAKNIYGAEPKSKKRKRKKRKRKKGRKRR